MKLRLLQINTTVNSGSTGRIAEEIGEFVINNGWDSYIAYGRGDRPSKSHKIKMGNKFDQAIHLLGTRLFDKHGLYSTFATRRLIAEIELIRPDILHLHNLHGYYLNIEVLFNYLRNKNFPLVWTLHDCWPFTGHCSYFDSVNCEKWKTHCKECPHRRGYPKSYFIDNSEINFTIKKRLFSNLQNLNIVTPSIWLKYQVEQSFLKNEKTVVINNGINLRTFNTRLNSTPPKKKKFRILGVASVWDKRKGLSDFIKLRQNLDEDFEVFLVGISKKLKKEIPDSIKVISRTENVEELADLYRSADVFINPTYVDNFPTTNLEALACGTPVITYNTGGSPEAIDDETGIVVEKGDFNSLIDAIKKIKISDRQKLSLLCRKRAESYFNKDDRIRDYFILYNSLIRS